MQIDEIVQIAATNGLLYGLSKKGTVYVLDAEEVTPEWIPLAKAPRITYAPKPKLEKSNA
jgi:hypothetical protein